MKKLVFPKFKWNIERSASLFAILLSLGTLVVFVYQTRLIRQQQYASVTPYLVLGTSKIGSGEMEITLENKGIGPAIVKDVYLKYQGKKYEMSPATFLKQILIIPDSLIDFTYSEIHPGLFLSAGEELEVFKASDSEAVGDYLNKTFFTDEARIYIVYESIYHEQWEITSTSLSPIKISN